MKKYFIFFLVFFGQSAVGIEHLERCDSPSQVHTFTSELEDIAVEGATPLILFNSDGQVVGVISATPTRAKDYPYVTTSVRLNKISLCSTTQVTEFFYTKGEDHLLLHWGLSPNREIKVFQDEGMLILTAKVELDHDKDHASKITLNFSMYDVFGPQSQKSNPSMSRSNATLLDDWGAPRISGTLYFFTPANWKWLQK